MSRAELVNGVPVRGLHANVLDGWDRSLVTHVEHYWRLRRRYPTELKDVVRKLRLVRNEWRRQLGQARAALVKVLRECHLTQLAVEGGA